MTFLMLSLRLFLTFLYIEGVIMIVSKENLVILDDISTIDVSPMCDPYINIISKNKEYRASNEMFSSQIIDALFLKCFISVVKDEQTGSYLCVTPNTLSILRGLIKDSDSTKFKVVAIDVTDASIEEIDSIILSDIYVIHIIFLLGSETFNRIGAAFKDLSKDKKKRCYGMNITQVEFSKHLNIGYSKMFDVQKEKVFRLFCDSSSVKYSLEKSVCGDNND